MMYSTSSILIDMILVVLLSYLITTILNLTRFSRITLCWNSFIIRIFRNITLRVRSKGFEGFSLLALLKQCQVHTCSRIWIGRSMLKTYLLQIWRKNQSTKELSWALGIKLGSFEAKSPDLWWANKINFDIDLSMCWFSHRA